MSEKEDKTHTSVNKNQNFIITEKGSLGLLAYGDIGLRDWRKVKQEFYKKDAE